MFGQGNRQQQLQTELDAARARVSELERALELGGMREPVTGLLTAAAFDQRLGEEVARAARYDRPLSVAVLEISDFCCLRLTHGEETAEHLLRATSVVLSHALRASDVTARMGDGDFLVLLPETTGEQASDCFDRVCRELTDRAVGPISTIDSRVGVSEHHAGCGASELKQDAGSALARVRGQLHSRVGLSDHRAAKPGAGRGR